MWEKASGTHCSDGVLLAHLDGELHGVARLRTAAHLRRCWECRGRLSEVEQQAEALARLTAAQAVSDSGRSAEAKAAFLAWKGSFEKSLPPAGARRTHAWRWSLAGAAACAAIALFFLPGPTQRTQPVPTADEVLRGVRGFQSELRQKPGAVHQVLSVDIVQTRPAVRRSAGRVETWSDRAGGRYASRWLHEGSTLKYAVWRRPGHAPFVYASDGSRSGGDGVSLFDLSNGEVTVERLERGLFEWLRTHDWELAPDFSEAVSRDGSTLRVERLDSGMLRLRASRSGKAVRADFTLDLEAASFRPKLQVIRFETAERELELRVASNRLEVVPPGRVDAAVFAPDVPRIPGVPPVPPLSRPVLAPPAPVRVAAGETEMEVLYALHRARACVGENVEVSDVRCGAGRGQGYRSNEQRRAELAEAIRQAGGDQVTVEIQIFEHGRPGPLRNHPLLPRDGARVIDGLYIEALALMRLAERRRPEKITVRERELMDAMVRDHVAALSSGTRLARAEVEPALAPLAGRQPEPGFKAPEPDDWRAAAIAIFRTLDHADDLLDLPEGAEPADARRRQAAEVLSALAELEQRVKQLDATMVNRMARE